MIYISLFFLIIFICIGFYGIREIAEASEGIDMRHLKPREESF